MVEVCKGTYACVRAHQYTYGKHWNMVANVDASDSSCMWIGKSINRDLRLVASPLSRTAVTRPGSRATVTSSPSVGAAILACINRLREKERKCKHCTIRLGTHSYKLKSPATDQYRSGRPFRGSGALGNSTPIEWEPEVVKPVPTLFIPGRDPMKVYSIEKRREEKKLKKGTPNW